MFVFSDFKMILLPPHWGSESYFPEWAEERRHRLGIQIIVESCASSCAVGICRKWNLSNYQYFFLLPVCQEASKCLERLLRTRLSSAWSPITVTLMARLFWATPFDVSTPRESWFFLWLKRFWNQPGKNLLLLLVNNIILLQYTRFCADNVFVFRVSLILFSLTIKLTLRRVCMS